MNPLAYLKIGLGAILLVAGWWGHGVYDDHLATKQARTEVEVARTGETAIIKFNTDYSKVKANVKDKCADTAMPASLLKLQSK